MLSKRWETVSTPHQKRRSEDKSYKTYVYYEKGIYNERCITYSIDSRWIKRMLDNFLSSSHHFSEEDENLQKFRFAFLNVLMLIAALFTFLNFIAAISGKMVFPPFFDVLLICYVLLSMLFQSILRRDKKHYYLVVWFFVLGSLVLFYAGLFMHTEDEFRLITFFLLLLITYVLLGKYIGLLLGFIIFTSILLIYNNYDLQLSSFVMSTFSTFFIIFNIFLYFFLAKVEKDATEFVRLNAKLKEKVSHEVQQRLKQEKMLLQQCRMASMGEMIDSIAHQWRQPLMSINAILLNMDRAIELKTKPDVYLEDKMDEVISLTTHMSQTIEDFRSLFKIDKEKHMFDVTASITYVLNLFTSSTKDIKIVFDESKKMSYRGYENELIQVMIILLSNAIEALKIKQIENKYLSITCTLKMEVLHITMYDNAGGIKKENIEKVFDPYFTTKSNTGGSGLGLYIAKIIIEQNMKGRLQVKTIHNGAEFKIAIPDG